MSTKTNNRLRHEDMDKWFWLNIDGLVINTEKTPVSVCVYPFSDSED